MNRLFKKIKDIIVTSVEPSTEIEDKIECAIDDNVVDCTELNEEPYVGVPAPEENVIDEWFADRTGEVIVEDLDNFGGNYEGPLYAPYTAVDEFKKKSIGDDGTHQRMYEIATKNHNTTIHLNPPGGSENFQEGPGGWNSGTGWGKVQK
jgi:hypothetical protein